MSNFAACAAAAKTSGRPLKRARVGFIGAGAFISSFHLLTAKNSPIIEIRAIADLDQNILNKHSHNMKVGYTTADYKKLLGDPEIDIIVIGTKQDMHAKLIIESLEFGKWVFCEKPMAENESEAQAVLEAERRSTGKLAIGFNRRFAPAYYETKKLMANVRRPWFMNYRLMFPCPDKGSGSYYGSEPRILYEGCHILDLICWMFDERPCRVYMTGDKLRNNCCILSFKDGSQVTFMCGSMGAMTFWKEYMELFSSYHAIAVSDFIDMRVRGFEGEYDRLYVPDHGMYAEEIRAAGFDWYEMLVTEKLYQIHDQIVSQSEDAKLMLAGRACRPVPLRIPVKANPVGKDPVFIRPDKGWKDSFEHFARAYLSGAQPQNANGNSGALATELAIALLKSLEIGLPVDF